MNFDMTASKVLPLAYPVIGTVSNVFCRYIRRPPYGCIHVINNNEDLMDPNDPSYDLERKHKILREEV